VTTLADYRARAERYRPQTVDELYAAIDSLYADGLRPRDISEALHLPLASVIEHLFDEGKPKC
jgi:hypothetical protein